MSDGGFADRLNMLFEAGRTADGRRLSNAKVAEALRERNVVVSREYLRQLRIGSRSNPRLPLVEALAEYFKVSTAYLLDGKQSEPQVPEQGPVESEHVLVSFFGPPARGKSDLIKRILNELPGEQSVIVIPAFDPASSVSTIGGQQFTSREMLEAIREWIDSQLNACEESPGGGTNTTLALVIPK